MRNYSVPLPSDWLLVDMDEMMETERNAIAWDAYMTAIEACMGQESHDEGFIRFMDDEYRSRQ